METIGEILPNGKVEKEYAGQGFIYKDFGAFENKEDKVCYVPELTDEDVVSEGYKYKDFLDLSKEFISRNEDVKEYCQKSNISVEDVAKDLFDMVDWQHPSTLIYDWENHGTYTS